MSEPASEPASTGGERILMVTSYPPVRDGIAAYAVQEVKRLLEAGHDVEVLSPGPSAAHHHLDLHGPRGPLALARRTRRYDRVIVQFHPDVFYPVPTTAATHAATSAGLALAVGLAHHCELRVHEVDLRLAKAAPPVGPAFRAVWRAADRITVHTEAERHSFATAFGLPLDRVAQAAHGGSFVRRTTLDRAGARARLGIPADEVMFLAIGFIQPHKGFDRALAAFASSDLGAGGCRLDIVGSVRVEEADYLDHLGELVEGAERTPGATVHNGFVSDEQFDLWLVAADVVVLPYRRIWSSSVLERAALYDRPVIATRVGGLEDQALSGTVLVDDDAALAAAMRAAAAERGAVRLAGPSAWPPGLVDREAVLAEVQARAAAVRGGRPPDRSGGLAPTARTRRALAVTAPLRRFPSLGLPSSLSARPGSTTMKRLIRRLTGWQVDPVIHHVNALQRTLTDVLDTLAEQGDEVPRGQGSDEGSPRRHASEASQITSW